MLKLLFILTFLSTLTLSSMATQASKYVYYGFEPDIVTNYVATNKKMGYVRLTVELMVEKGNSLTIVEHHSALLRDAIIDIIGNQTEAKIKSIKGRAEIQLLCEEKVNALLVEETGQALIKRLLFTQWLAD